MQFVTVFQILGVEDDSDFAHYKKKFDSIICNVRQLMSNDSENSETKFDNDFNNLQSKR